MLLSDIQIGNKEAIKKYTLELLPYVDSFLSKHTSEFDTHRIFKLPGTVDASNGIIVSTMGNTLQFDDRIVPFL